MGDGIMGSFPIGRERGAGCACDAARPRGRARPESNPGPFRWRGPGLSQDIPGEMAHVSGSWAGASSASARARRSWRRPRATAAPSASSARSRSSCSGSRHSRPSSSYDSRCSVDSRHLRPSPGASRPRRREEPRSWSAVQLHGGAPRALRVALLGLRKVALPACEGRAACVRRSSVVGLPWRLRTRSLAVCSLPMRRRRGARATLEVAPEDRLAVPVAAPSTAATASAEPATATVFAGASLVHVERAATHFLAVQRRDRLRGV